MRLRASRPRFLISTSRWSIMSVRARSSRSKPTAWSRYVLPTSACRFAHSSGCTMVSLHLPTRAETWRKCASRMVSTWLRPTEWRWTAAAVSPTRAQVWRWGMLPASKCLTSVASPSTLPPGHVRSHLPTRPCAHWWPR